MGIIYDLSATRHILGPVDVDNALSPSIAVPALRMNEEARGISVLASSPNMSVVSSTRAGRSPSLSLSLSPFPKEEVARGGD